MPGFVITVTFEVEPGGAGPGTSAVADRWGDGHLFSYCDGDSITLVVEVTAPEGVLATASVLARAEIIWEALTGRPLPAPVTLRLEELAPRPMLLGGAVGRGPDRLFAEAAADRAACLRAEAAALAVLADD